MIRFIVAATTVAIYGALLAATPASLGAQDNEINIVAVGDSYSAGVGLGDVTEGCDRDIRGTHAGVAVQQLQSDPSLQHLNIEYSLAACTGAVTGYERVLTLFEPNLNSGVYEIAHTGGGSILWQIENAVDRSTDVVTITAGGNDIGFADLIGGCYTWFGCGQDALNVDVADTKSIDWDELYSRLVSLYGEARTRMNATGHVYVLTYPIPYSLEHTNCDGMYRQEQLAANSLATRLSDVVALAAQEADRRYGNVELVEWRVGTRQIDFYETPRGDIFDTYDTPFGVCSDEPMLNGFVNNAAAPWVDEQNSYHPSAFGYSYAGRLLYGAILPQLASGQFALPKCAGVVATVIGSPNDDVLTGTTGRDVIVGLGGNDRIRGLEGNDIICGGSGNDVIEGNQGNDQIWGQDGQDTIRGGLGNDTIWGGNHDDELRGQTGNDTVHGGNGNDHLIGWTGNDKLYGNAGNDQLRGENGTDELRGGSGNDRLWGGNDDDQLWGGTGNDMLDGDAGNDRLDGSAGTDSLDGDNGWDNCLNGERGPNTCENAPFPKCAGVVATVIGSPNDDVLTGTTGRDVIVGLGGNDRIRGLEGNDIICGGSGNDVIEGNQGNDQIWGQDGQDTIRGGLGNDTIWGGNHDDELRGQTGNDTVHGGNGNDHLIGWTGNDKLYGNAGNDQLRGENGTDELRGGSGNDRLWGGNDDDQLWGGTGNDMLDGDAGNDRLDGSAGTDSLDGDNGWDNCFGRENGPGDCESGLVHNTILEVTGTGRSINPSFLVWQGQAYHIGSGTDYQDCHSQVSGTVTKVSIATVTARGWDLDWRSNIDRCF